MWIRSHETASFFVLTFAFTWAFWIPSAVIFAGSASPDSLITSPLFVSLQTLGAVGPSVVAIALTLVLHGKEQVRALLRRFKPSRHLAGWYVVAATLAPGLTVLTMATESIVSGDPFVDPGSGLAEMASEMGWVGAVVILPVVFASQLFSSPLLEEAGWRGFALPRMQARVSALTASLMLGAAWGLWHLPLVLAYGDRLAPYLVGLTAYTVLMTWVFNSGGGNMFLALLFHASLNLSLNVLLPTQSEWTSALVASGAAVVVVLVFGPKNLSTREPYVV